MGTTAQKLQAIQNSKSAIKAAIEAKGVSDVGDVLSTYATKIASIPSGGSSGDPRYEVSEQGALNKKSFAVNWFNDLTSISENGLYYAYYQSNVTSVSFPNVTIVGSRGIFWTFYQCTSLTTVDLSKVTSVDIFGLSNAFCGCTSLTSVDLSSLSTDAGSNSFLNTFNGCTALEVVDFSEATSVPAINTNTFKNTNSTFKVVVPDSLYNSWITASNWSAISSHIVKASEYTPAS